MNENERIVALTTIDNPYDPVDQYDDWYAFDTQKVIAQMLTLHVV